MRTILLVPTVVLLTIVSAAISMSAGNPFGNGLAQVSEQEAQQVSGGACPILLNVGNMCGLWGGGLKFWEYCPDIPFFAPQSPLPGTVNAAPYTCVTSCGYTCGSSTSLVACTPPPA